MSLRVLVTGANGLLGTAVCAAFGSRGHDVMAFEGDLTHPEDVAAVIARVGRADAVIHTAAATDVNRCEREREWGYAANVNGTHAAVRIARALGARLVYISTVSVFDGMVGDYREADLPNPKNWYNVTKMIGEEIVRDEDHSLIVRLNLIGIHHGNPADASAAIPRGRNFLEWLIGAIRRNEDMALFTDVRINPLSNLTVADLLLESLERGINDRILHLGARDVVSKADIGRFFLERCHSYAGRATFMASGEVQESAYRPKEMWLHTGRAEIVFGRAFPTVRQELERIWNASVQSASGAIN